MTAAFSYNQPMCTKSFKETYTFPHFCWWICLWTFGTGK